MNGRPYSPYGGKRRRVWWRVLLELVLLCVVAFGALEVAVLSGGRTQIVGQPQVMVIFGCKVEPWGPSELLTDRLETALPYLLEHPDTTVVVTGGQGPDEPESEAKAMHDWLVARGVESTRILQEPHSSNTWQNVNYTAKLLREQGYAEDIDGVLLVSNGFHLTRIRMLSSRVWGDAYTFSTLAAPSSHLPSRMKMYVREPLALVKSFIIDR